MTTNQPNRIRTKLRAIERAEDTRRIGAPQCLPLLGDGIHARAVLSPITGGPDSYLTRNRRGNWYNRHLDVTRADLIAARYRDFLDSRNI